MNISPIQMKSELQQYHSQTKRNNSVSFTSTRGADLLEKILEQKVTDKKQLSNLLKSSGFGRFGMFSKKQIAEILEELPKMFADIQGIQKTKQQLQELIDAHIRKNELRIKDFEEYKKRWFNDLWRDVEKHEEAWLSEKQVQEDKLKAKQKELKELEEKLEVKLEEKLEEKLKPKQKEFETIEAKLKEREAKLKEREQKLDEKEQKILNQEDMLTAQQKDELASQIRAMYKISDPNIQSYSSYEEQLAKVTELLNKRNMRPDNVDTLIISMQDDNKVVSKEKMDFLEELTKNIGQEDVNHLSTAIDIVTNGKGNIDTEKASTLISSSKKNTLKSVLEDVFGVQTTDFNREIEEFEAYESPKFKTWEERCEDKVKEDMAYLERSRQASKNLWIQRLKYS